MKENSIFTSPVHAVNIGARLLGEALEQQETDVIILNWRPPVEVHLSDRIKEILDKME